MRGEGEPKFEREFIEFMGARGVLYPLPAYDIRWQGYSEEFKSGVEDNRWWRAFNYRRRLGISEDGTLRGSNQQ